MKSLIDVIKTSVTEPRNDRMLHFSSDLQNPRHTAIAWKYGIPHTTKPWMNTFPLLQGTAIHEELHRIMNRQTDWKYVYEQSILVEDYNYPWCGTVDAYLEAPDGKVWLLDYKTASGVSLSFMDGAKPDHVMQVSAYYHFGIRIPNMSIGILYLPTSPDYKRRWSEPMFYEVTPMSLEDLHSRMVYVETCVREYEDYATLPDPLEGEYSWKINKRNKNWEYWYKPHYSSMFCPWKDEEFDPCGCSKQVSELIKVSDDNPNEENDDDSI